MGSGKILGMEPVKMERLGEYRQEEGEDIYGVGNELEKLVTKIIFEGMEEKTKR